MNPRKPRYRVARIVSVMDTAQNRMFSGVPAFTDYPVKELGDVADQEAPVRSCLILSWDGNKYCDVLVGGVVVSFKAGYLYTRETRYDPRFQIRVDTLGSLPSHYIRC